MLPGAPRVHRDSLVAPGGSWGLPGGSLRARWGFSKASWDSLRTPWGSWGLLGAPWRLLGGPTGLAVCAFVCVGVCVYGVCVFVCTGFVCLRVWGLCVCVYGSLGAPQMLPKVHSLWGKSADSANSGMHKARLEALKKENKRCVYMCVWVYGVFPHSS